MNLEELSNNRYLRVMLVKFRKREMVRGREIGIVIEGEIIGIM